MVRVRFRIGEGGAVFLRHNYLRIRPVASVLLFHCQNCWLCSLFHSNNAGLFEVNFFLLRIWLVKVTKNQDFTLSLENTFLEKNTAGERRTGGGQIDQPILFRIKEYFLFGFYWINSLLQLSMFAWSFHVCNFIKKGLRHRCFFVNFAKFFRASFFKECLWWLLLIFVDRVHIIFMNRIFNFNNSLINL